MNHTNLLKQAFKMTWHYRALWVFGFFLALCGGGGGGGGGNFNYSSSGNEFSYLKDMPNMPSIDPNTIFALIAGFFCLLILFIILSVVIQMVARTALISMVRQVRETEAVTVAEGLHLGWSSGAWRVFLVGLVVGLPLAIVSIILILLALSPLLLIFTQNTGLIVISIILTVLAFLFVIFILIILGAIIAPFLDLARRRTVLDEQGVFASLGGTVEFIKRNFKDVFIVWLLMFGVGIGWTFIALIVILPVSLIAAVLIGGIPAAIVYFISNSVIGAAIAGVPLAILAIILVSSFLTGFYLIFRSSVWTLAYLEIQELDTSENQADEAEFSSPLTSPQPEP